MPGYFREIAVRLFAKELKESDIIFREDDEQYAPQYVLTPTGAKANRILISGVLTEVENIGAGTEYYKARIADPTGTFLVYAGQYQAEATDFLSKAKTPSFVTVVGKVTAFKADDGTLIFSIRPEYIQNTDQKSRDFWTLETAQKTYDRITAAESEDMTDENIKNALEHYQPDFTEYRKMILKTLETVAEN